MIDPGNDALTERIAKRVSQMIASGFADEVRGLVARYGREARALGAVGYREMVEHVCDGVSLAETELRIVQATRIYARRQRTWLKNEPGELWLTSADEVLGEAGMVRLCAFLGR